MTAQPERGQPLARLLAIGYRTLIDALHDRLRAQGWTDVRPAFGYVLLAARDKPVTSSELAALMGTSKQATSKLIDLMESCGYLRRNVDTDDARQRPVTLTKLGHELLSTVESNYDELEREWADNIGQRNLDRLRRDLTKILTTPDGNLPAVRPTV